MSYLELPGMGSAAGAVGTVIASAIGPLVKGGADIYATREGTKLSKRELRQRETEARRLYELSRKQLQAQERQQMIAQQAALQRSKVWGYWVSRNMPYLVGGAVLIALGLAASRVGRPR